MQVYPPTVEIPDEILTNVGLVIVSYASVEHMLAKIVQDLLGIGPKHARVAIGTPRADSQLTRIEQLMQLEGLLPAVDIPKLKVALNAVEKKRDLIAHGQWLRHPSGEVLLQDTAGNWQPDPKVRGKVPRRIMPEGVHVTEQWLLEVMAGVVEASKSVVKLGEQARAFRKARSAP